VVAEADTILVSKCLFEIVHTAPMNVPPRFNLSYSTVYGTSSFHMTKSKHSLVGSLLVLYDIIRKTSPVMDEEIETVEFLEKRI